MASPWYKTFTREHWLVFSGASLAWMFDCLDSQFFNLARDDATEQVLGDPARTILFAPYTTSMFLLGWAAGGLLFGALGDRFGRARLLTITILIYSLSTGMAAFAKTFPELCVCLFVTGTGVGGVFGLSVALVADTVEDRARAPALGLLQSLSAWGNILAGFIGMGIGVAGARHLLPFSLHPWQALFLAGAAPALLAVFVMSRMKEPERWRQARESGAQRGIKFGSYGQLLRHPRWRKNAWLGLIACSSGIIGLWGIGNFHPKIVGAIIEADLSARHLSAAAMSSEKAYWRSIGLVLQNVGGFLGMMSLSKLAQVKGRRPAFALALLLSFLSTGLVFEWMRHIGQLYWMLPLMGFGQYSVFGVFAVYLPELFPISLRSTGTGFCYNGGRVVAASAPFTLSRITARLGGDVEGFRTAGLWVSLVLLVGIAVLPFLPETKDRPLPEE